jgi:regulator of RNase E activity RraA
MSATTSHAPDLPGVPADAALLSRFATLPAANIGDAMDRLGVLDSRIQAVWPGATIVGTAFTVWTRSGDNKLIHEAIEQARPGDVITVNGGGDESRALIGELIGGRAKARGIAGFVIDGAVRDAQGLAEYDMPVFARAVTPAGPYKFGPGILGEPVAVGGVVVTPGDIVVADGDGVVIIPLARAAQIADAAEAKRDREDASRATIEAALRDLADGRSGTETTGTPR